MSAKLIIAALVVWFPALNAITTAAASAQLRTQANVVQEISLESARPHDDPFNELTVDAVFTEPSGKTLRVPAFWAGGKVWKVRYASPVVGTHRFRTECSDSADTGLHGIEGQVEVEPYRGDNALLRHGAIRVAADHRHFEHADGTPFLWIGDTWWMGLCKRLHWPDEFQTLTGDRKQKGFNVIQIVAGLYPDQGAFDERGANEAGFPWEKDYARIRPEYFDLADRRIEYLVDQGFVPCIVGAWGYHLPWLGERKMEQHLRYLVARWGAMSVVWCAAGEFNLPYYLAPGFPRGGEKQAAQWADVIRSLRQVNAFDRPITAHPTGIEPLSARLVLRKLGKDERLLDFDMLQTGHGLREVLAPTVSTLRASYSADPPMPVINGEVAYEALSGRIPADVPRLMCWACLLSGAAGHTYGANGIWQLNRKDQPYGNSPHGGNYGSIPWDEAMRLPGSAQVGLAGKLLRSMPFEKFEPHPDWAEWQTPGADKYLVPYAAGIPRALRVIYVPTAAPIRVPHLEPGVRYDSRIFDPLTGKTTELAAGSAAGESPSFSPPAGWDHDWVLLMESPHNPAAAGDVLFHDTFREKLGEGWTWRREDPKAWRTTDHGLEVRIQPGNMWGPANDGRNVLIRPAPDPQKQPVEITAAVEHHPTNQYEQVDLCWYYDDGHMVKVGEELVDGKLSVVMGREENDRTRTISITPLDSNAVQLRMRVSGNTVHGQFKTPKGEWRDVGQCDLPVKGEPKISLQFYQGPPDAEHWANVSDFVIRRL